MKRLCVLLLITILPTLLVAQDKQAANNRPIVFRNVTLIDMRSEQPQTDMTVIVKGERIAKIGKSGKMKIPKNAEVVDAKGKFLMPGLWDSFTYTLEAEKYNLPFFKMMIAHGVTDVRDSGTTMDLAEVEKLQNDINAGRVLAPRLFYSGRYINGANLSERTLNIRPSFQAKDADEAASYVETLWRNGVDYISIGGALPPELVSAVVAAAKKHNLPVLSYVALYPYGKASDLGVNCIEHFADLDRTTSTKREEYFAINRERRKLTPDESYAFIKTLVDSPDKPFYKATLQTLAKNKTCVATNFSEFGFARNTFDLTDLSRRRYKTKQQLEQFEEEVKEFERQKANGDMRASEKETQRHLDSILEMNKAGVPLVAGTQSNPGEAKVSPGIWLHDELFYFVKAGLTPYEALKTATVNPAIFMRREKDLGTIEKGKLADLILLDANPLLDISNTRKINAVVANGRYLSREDLDKILSDIEAKAKEQ